MAQSVNVLASIIAPPRVPLPVIEITFDVATEVVLRLLPNGAIINFRDRTAAVFSLNEVGTIINTVVSNIACSRLVEPAEGANQCVSASITISTNDPDVNLSLLINELRIAIWEGGFTIAVNEQGQFVLVDIQLIGEKYSHTPSAAPSESSKPSVKPEEE